MDDYEPAAIPVDRPLDVLATGPLQEVPQQVPINPLAAEHLLVLALQPLELGEYDYRIRDWAARQDQPTLYVLASWLHRMYAAGQAAAAAAPASAAETAVETASAADITPELVREHLEEMAIPSTDLAGRLWHAVAAFATPACEHTPVEVAAYARAALLVEQHQQQRPHQESRGLTVQVLVGEVLCRAADRDTEPGWLLEHELGVSATWSGPMIRHLADELGAGRRHLIVYSREKHPIELELSDEGAAALAAHIRRVVSR